MPRTQENLELLREQRRAAILAAAATVFSKRGFAAAKIGDIARAAGLSHGLVYHYFENKEALLTELLQTRTREGEVVFEQLGGGHAIDRLRQMLSYMLHEREPELSLVLIHALVNDSLPQGARAVLKGHARRIFETVSQVVQSCREEGLLLSDERTPDEVTSALLSAARGFALHQNIDLGLPIAAPSVDLVLRMALPAPAARDIGCKPSAAE